MEPAGVVTYPLTSVTSGSSLCFGKGPRAGRMDPEVSGQSPVGPHPSAWVRERKGSLNSKSGRDQSI